MNLEDYTVSSYNDYSSDDTPSILIEQGYRYIELLVEGSTEIIFAEEKLAGYYTG